MMKLWRDNFAPNLLEVEGPNRPINFVATRSGDKQTIYLKAVNPTDNAVEATITLDGAFAPKAATMQLVAPGNITAKNTLDQPDNIKVVPAAAVIENRSVKFTMPALSAGVVKVTQ